jgi:D-tyrosyl-tRNA(Tyr) deacylase
MKAVLQRVKSASVTIEEKINAEIGKGLLVLLGIEESDADEDIAWLSGKIARMRLFADDGGVMNLSIGDIGGELLVVSQFTLHASTRKGNRPSYIKAAVPATAIPLYEKFIAQMEADVGKPIQTGEFGAMMDVQLINDGPVTIVIDSKNRI